MFYFHYFFQMKVIISTYREFTGNQTINRCRFLIYQIDLSHPNVCHIHSSGLFSAINQIAPLLSWPMREPLTTSNPTMIQSYTQQKLKKILVKSFSQIVLKLDHSNEASRLSTVINIRLLAKIWFSLNFKVKIG